MNIENIETSFGLSVDVTDDRLFLTDYRTGNRFGLGIAQAEVLQGCLAAALERMEKRRLDNFVLDKLMSIQSQNMDT